MNTKSLNGAVLLEEGQSNTFSSAKPLFEKRTIVELSDNELADINGGTSPLTVSSGYCIGGGIALSVFIGTAIVGYF